MGTLRFAHATLGYFGGLRFANPTYVLSDPNCTESTMHNILPDESDARANWVLVMICCACSVFAQLGLMAQFYDYYVVRDNLHGAPWISFYSIVNELIFFCPVIAVLLARRERSIVLFYAAILVPIATGRAIEIFHGAARSGLAPTRYDLATLIHGLLGYFSATCLAIGLSITVISRLSHWIRRTKRGN